MLEEAGLRLARGVLGDRGVAVARADLELVVALARVLLAVGAAVPLDRPRVVRADLGQLEAADDRRVAALALDLDDHVPLAPPVDLEAEDGAAALEPGLARLRVGAEQPQRPPAGLVLALPPSPFAASRRLPPPSPSPSPSPSPPPGPTPPSPSGTGAGSAGASAFAAGSISAAVVSRSPAPGQRDSRAQGARSPAPAEMAANRYTLTKPLQSLKVALAIGRTKPHPYELRQEGGCLPRRLRSNRARRDADSAPAAACPPSRLQRLAPPEARLEVVPEARSRPRRAPSRGRPPRRRSRRGSRSGRGRRRGRRSRPR